MHLYPNDYKKNLCLYKKNFFHPTNIKKILFLKYKNDKFSIK